ncbi:MAG: hypothetical protein ACFB0C_05055 [Leptolyngbyaceae cyanobacterium]
MGIVLPVLLSETLCCQQGRWVSVLGARQQHTIEALGWHRRGGGV